MPAAFSHDAKRGSDVKELRIGLVLYGGVALSVYIKGVVTEIWHVLRASRALADEKDKNGGSLDVEPPDYLGSTARLYFGLLKDLAKQGEEIRVVVDTVAGTSAGGVNGVALYKAIVEGGDASLLNGVWLKDADISNLKGEPDKSEFLLRSTLWTLRRIPLIGRITKAATLGGALEWEWVRNTVITLVRGKDPRRTPLKGDFFTRIIGKCLWQMGKPRPGAFRLLPSSGSFDLFLTQTDLHGWPRHVPLSRTYHENPLKERTQAHVMRFEMLPKDAGGFGRNSMPRRPSKRRR